MAVGSNMDKFSVASFILAGAAFMFGMYLQQPWQWPLNFLIFMSFAGIGSVLALYGIYRMMRESTRSSSAVENLILSLIRVRGGVSVADIVIEGKVTPAEAARSLNKLVQLRILKAGMVEGKTMYALS
ncbi:MAG: hypothetical protein V1857_04035 [archaeon]